MSFDKEKDTVAVTGASGFLGSRVVELLVQQGYKNIVGTFNRNPPTSALRYVTNAQLNLGESDSINTFLKTHTPKAIINLAAIFDFSAHAHKVHAVNVRGSFLLFRRGIQRGVEHFVQTSSGTVYENGTSLTEEAHTSPLEPYAQSKAELEELIRGSRHSDHAAIIRPAAIYGPQSKYGATLALFAQYLTARLCLGATAAPLGGKNNVASYVHVDDAAQAHIFAFENQLNGVYNISDQKPLSHRELGEIVQGAMQIPGYRNVLSGMSIPLAKAPLNFARKLGQKLVSERLGIPLDEGALTYMFAGNFGMNSQKIIDAGFSHAYPLSHEGMVPVIQEYIRDDWAPLVGNSRVRKVLSFLR